MTALFLKILSLSTTASFLMVAVIVLRLVLKKAPKGMRYVLWAMVGLRLIFPFTLESPFSVLPSEKQLSADTLAPATNAMTTTAPTAVTHSESVDVLQVLTYVWIIGAVLMLLYMLISVIRVHIMVRERVQYKDEVYLCDHVSSPFVLGVIKPKIYLNSSMSKRDMNLIIAHERTHIKHCDNIFKPLGFVILCVYWFNPLCWVSYFLFVKDIELFCDESVVKNLSKKGKKNYSYALLSCSSSKSMVTACPLAFAENSVKTRIKNILNYKKPALYIVVISATLCVITMLMFMTNPVSAKEKEDVKAVEPTVAQTVYETQAVAETPTQAHTQAPTAKSTEKPTEKQAESAVENDYNDDSYYSEDYYNEADWAANAAQELDEMLEQQREEFAHIYDSYGTNTNNYSSWSEPYNPLPDTIYMFEPPNGINVGSASSSSSGVQRADGYTGSLWPY